MKRTSDKGYTLVELGITLAIISLLAVIAVPNLREIIARYRFQSAVRTLANDLNLTRLQAISRDREYMLKVDKTNDTYMVYEGNLSENSTSWTFKSQVRFDQGVDIFDLESLEAAGQDSLIFKPDGTLNENIGSIATEPDLYGEISLQGQGGAMASKLHVEAPTGRVTVFRNVNGTWKDERYLKE